MKVFFSILFFSIIIYSCIGNKTKVMRTLEKADSLFNTENDNDAYKTFIKINRNDIKSDDERALYTLLENELYTETEYPINITTDNDSDINFIINHYKKNNDYKHLARAYYSKVIKFHEKGDLKNALLSMKKAETYDNKDETPWLRMLIYVNLSYLNSKVGADVTGLEYAKKALCLAKKDKKHRGPMCGIQ